MVDQKKLDAYRAARKEEEEHCMKVDGLLEQISTLSAALLKAINLTIQLKPRK